MSKYNLLKSKPDNETEWFLQIIANELAEANRLKRIELELMNQRDDDRIKDQYLVSWIRDKA